MIQLTQFDMDQLTPYVRQTFFKVILLLSYVIDTLIDSSHPEMFLAVVIPFSSTHLYHICYLNMTKRQIGRNYGATVSPKSMLCFSAQEEAI